MKLPWTKKEIAFVIGQYKKGFNRFDIAKTFLEKFLYQRSPDSIKHCIDVYGQEVELYVPKVLILDIETAPLLSYHWGLWDQNVALNQIVKDWHILSFSCKWLGEKEENIIYMDKRGKKGKALENDRPLLIKLRELINDSDLILHQNGTAFDMKKINAKFIEYDMEPPSRYKNIDTLLMAKRLFAFTSNKLEYMTKKFCTKYKKQDHSDFSGFKLWEECLKGNIKAWKSMEKYNKFDILSLEELFVKMSKYDKSKNVQDAMRAYKIAKGIN